MIVEPITAFVPAEYRIKYATEAWELGAAAALRRQVFCEEQGLFVADDRDAVDDVATAIVAVSTLAVTPHDVVGTVRIHEPEPGVWWGSRLAVAAPYRKVGLLGASLIRLAVSSAHGQGARRFFAHVQSQNAPLFRRLRWTTLDETSIHGRPHHFMEADLAYYPPIADPQTGFLSLLRKRGS